MLLDSSKKSLAQTSLLDYYPRGIHTIASFVVKQVLSESLFSRVPRLRRLCASSAQVSRVSSVSNMHSFVLFIPSYIAFLRETCQNQLRSSSVFFSNGQRPTESTWIESNIGGDVVGVTASASCVKGSCTGIPRIVRFLSMRIRCGTVFTTCGERSSIRKSRNQSRNVPAALNMRAESVEGLEI